MLPTVPNPLSRLSNELHPDDFTTIDLMELEEIGCAVAGIIADISHHNIGDPGEWALTGDGPTDLATLREALGKLTTSVRRVNRVLARIERRARRRAVDRAATERGL